MEVAVVVVVMRDDSGGTHLLLRKRPSTGLLAGMWEFPGAEVEGTRTGSITESTVRGRARERAILLSKELGLGHPRDAAGGMTFPTMDLPMVAHVFSHLKVRYWPFVLVWEPPVGGWPVTDGGRWVPIEEMELVPLPVAQRKIGESLPVRLKI